MNVVAHNLAAMNASLQYNIVTNKQKKSTEKLSSGYKINRAADDAAGLSISEKMRRQIRGLSQGVLNAEDGVSMCQVADGALSEVNDMLHRINELAIKSANGTNSDDDRSAIQDEVSQLKSEIDRIGNTTTFNSKKLFDGTMSRGNITSEDDTIPITYDEAKDQLMSVTYKRFKTNKVSVDGTVFTSNEANAYSAELSQYLVSENMYTNNWHYKGPNDPSTSNVLDTMKKIVAATYDMAKENLDMNGDSTLYQNRVNWLNETTNALNAGYSATPSQLISAMGSIPDANIASIKDARITGYTACLVIEAGQVNAGAVSGSAFGIVDNWYDKYDFTKNINTVLNITSQNGVIANSADDAINKYMTFINNTKEIKDDDGSDAPSGLWIQSGCDTLDGMTLFVEEMNTSSLGISSLDVSTVDGADEAMNLTGTALIRLMKNRSQIGAQQNRLEHTIANENNIVENTTAAESRIRDTDMASEMVKYSNMNILAQAGQAMMAQANQSNQGVLSLLQG